MNLKPEELRLGNYFILPNGNVGKITYHEIRLLVISPDTEKPNYSPIPLSEDWLNKVDRNENNIFWGNFSQDNSGYFIWVGGFKCYLRYVHTLQNCFYALTGTELKETSKNENS